MKNKILLFLLTIFSFQSIIFSDGPDTANVDSDQNSFIASWKKCPKSIKALISLLATTSITGWGVYFYAKGRIKSFKDRANYWRNLFYERQPTRLNFAWQRIKKKREALYIRRLEKELRKYGVDPSEAMVFDFLDENK